MYQILLVVEKPDQLVQGAPERWMGFLKYVETTAKQDEAIEVLGSNVLLIHIGTTLDGLRESLAFAKGLRYRYTIFPETQLWHGNVQEKANRR